MFRCMRRVQRYANCEPASQNCIERHIAATLAGESLQEGAVFGLGFGVFGGVTTAAATLSSVSRRAKET